VDIIRPDGISSGKYSVEGEEVILRRAKKGIAPVGYTAKWSRSCLFPYRTQPLWPLPFKTLHFKLMLIDGSDECVQFIPGSDGVKASLNMPVWTREAVSRLFEANVLKTSGNISTEMKVPGLMYVLIGISIVMGLMSMLAGMGKLKF